MNPNIYLAQVFVDELRCSGVREVCIAPGSRSTPLALAFASHPGFRYYMHLDERSAAFFALGLALALDRPVAVLCTSGSAAANFFPAIIEARMSGIPLLVLTADRPHELRGSGANQTIDQVKLYGDQVLWSVDMPLPVADLPALAQRNVRTMAARSVAIAGGIPKGPVHLNFPFRKPLEPGPSENLTKAGWEAGAMPHTRFSRGRLALTWNELEELASILRTQRRGLIVCGPRCPRGDFAQAVRQLSQRSGYPVFADPLSGVRFGWPEVVGGYDGFLSGKLPSTSPEVILRFGSLPTSSALSAYLDKISPDHRIHIVEHGVWQDDSHRTTWFIQAEPALVCKDILGRLEPQASSDWWDKIFSWESRYWQAIEAELEGGEFFDGAAVAEVVKSLPQEARLFIGNSLPVRHLDTYGRPTQKCIEVFGSRGASGIDGNISTALGIAAADQNRLLVAVIGDITFYHDMNGLYALQKHGLHNMLIVLLNNNGGGIFRRLPVSRFEPPFEEMFLTAHNLDFAHAARMYGLEYRIAPDRERLREELSESFRDGLAGGARLIEVRTDSAIDLRQHRKIMETAAKLLSG